MDLIISSHSPKKMSVIRQQTVSGLKWTTLSQASRLGSQLLSVIMLARLLPPADYGLAAMAAVVTGFVSLFRDFGTAAAIIQKQNLSQKLLDSVFWLNVAFGLSLACLLGLLAPLIANVFSEPRLKEVLWVLLLTFPIASLGAVHQALLEKASHFRQLAIIESIAAFMSLIGAILAAWSGWGVYSLVLQALLVTSISTIGLWMVSQWRPVFRWEAKEIRDLIGFSGNLVGFNVFNYFIRNADNFLIGRFLGASELGYYSMAYRLMLWPLQNISNVVGRVLFPALSSLQSNHDRLASAYIRATAAITLITAPLMLGFFVLREPFVAVALGSRWLPVANILAWLVPVGLLQSIGTTVGTLYLATGRTDVMFKWGVGTGLLVIPAFYIGLNWGAVGVAAAYAIVSMLLFLPSLAIPFRWVGLRVRDVLFKLLPSIFSATIMALLVAVIAAIWGANMQNQLYRLIILVALGIVVYGVLSLILQRVFLRDIVRAIFRR
jgi:O-antigen/teichoic acid export membrane protein